MNDIYYVQYYDTDCKSLNFDYKDISLFYYNKILLKKKFYKNNENIYKRYRWKSLKISGYNGDCIQINNIFNLIIKNNSQELTMSALYDAFFTLYIKCIKQSVSVLVIPKINDICIQWSEILDIINEIFNNSDIIIVYYQPMTKANIEKVCNNMEGYW